PDCAPGQYPDPLVPFERTTAPAGKNTALWFTIHVTDDVVAGDYRGTVVVEADGIEPVNIPLKLHVWSFALPKLSFLRTAYACWYDTLCRWHGATSLEDKRKIAILTNRNFFEHRISPINPMAYWDYRTEPTPDGVKIIWDDWDKGAELFLPHMNSFNLPGAFMSAVKKHRADEPGYAEEKIQFLKLVAAHLKEKGWFEKGYNYIFDEPDPDMYAAIVREADIWHKADPGFKILLTEQPEPELYGAVDIWTPVLDAYIRPICQARQKKGEEVWWYVCCGPHHPYPNNFIDYPAIDHRILHWMNWKYKVTGVLYWQTTFWVGSPWEHTMNDADGKNLGNGDGS
ncbi:MAG: glycoside hydrolase domain-containing protein, partial [Armatimonadota bacterium]